MSTDLSVKNARLIKLQTVLDGFDGILSIAEIQRDIPFEVRRVYYIYNLIKHKDVMRGKHAHKKLEQMLFCVNGSCVIELDDGENKQEILLNSPNVGIYVGTKLWHTMKNFQNNCILLVLASDVYKESDYIRDYEEFVKYIKTHA